MAEHVYTRTWIARAAELLRRQEPWSCVIARHLRLFSFGNGRA